MPETTKQRVYKRPSRTHVGPDWDQAYLDSFLEKYCADPAPAETDEDDDVRVEHDRLARMTERERIIAKELTAKLELESSPEPLAVSLSTSKHKGGGAVVTLAYLSIILALATSAFVVLSR